MPSVGIRELQRDTSGIVGRVAETRRPAFITNRGEVVAVVLPVDPEALEDFVLASAPDYVRSMEEADLALIEGRTRSAVEVFAEIEGPAAELGGDAAALVETTGLTPRERQIIVLVAKDRSSEAIARELSISQATVRSHIGRILTKLQTHQDILVKLQAHRSATVDR
jgi:prevent-host-death family protein